MRTGSDEHGLAMLRVAELYYEQRLTQDQIATRLNLTRWKVGRLLEEARTQGVVTIQINHPRARRHEDERALVEAFSLDAAVVVPSRPDAAQLSEAVALAAAEFLCDLRPSPRVLGVSWGRTLTQVATSIPPGWASDVHVCQVNGAVSRSRRPSSGADVATEIARQASGTVALLPAPAILASAATRRALEADPVIADVLEVGRHADALLYSPGAVSTDSVLVEAGYLTREEIRELRARGALGDVLGRFIDADGDEVDAELSDRTVGLGLDDIRRATTVIAVASGVHKIPIARTVVRAGLCTVLVTDSDIARQLLAAAPPEPPAPGPVALTSPR